MIQYIYRPCAWEVLKDFMWWYFIVKCDKFHPSLNLNMRKVMRSSNFIEARGKESLRVADARYRAHRLDILYKDTITRR